MDIKDELKKFIMDKYLRGFGRRGIAYDDSFLEKGIIDSIGVIELASHIQKTYGIKIKVPEIVPENFDSLNKLEKYITKKIGHEK